jgi:hypothetical protein
MWSAKPAQSSPKCNRRDPSARINFVSGQVAQLVERSPEKAGVGGSIPSLATTFQTLTTSPPPWFVGQLRTADPVLSSNELRKTLEGNGSLGRTSPPNLSVNSPGSLCFGHDAALLLGKMGTSVGKEMTKAKYIYPAPEPFEFLQAGENGRPALAGQVPGDRGFKDRDWLRCRDHQRELHILPPVQFAPRRGTSPASKTDQKVASFLEATNINVTQVVEHGPRKRCSAGF